MPTQISPTGRILVGADGSPASVAAVRWAAREAQLRGMRVHVVYVRDKRLPTPHYAPQPRASEADLGQAAGDYPPCRRWCGRPSARSRQASRWNWPTGRRRAS